MEIEKDYFPLAEIVKRWSIPEEDLVYLAENNQLRLSIRVFDLPLEFGDYEEDSDGARFRAETLGSDALYAAWYGPAGRRWVAGQGGAAWTHANTGDVRTASRCLDG